MSPLRNLSIRRKLTLVIMLPCSVVLLATFVSLLGFQALSTREQFARDLSMLAKVLAHNSAASVSFNNGEGGELVLAGLEDRQDIEYAVIVVLTGERIASYERGKKMTGADEVGLFFGHRFIGGDVLVAAPIIHDGRTLGTLYLRADFLPSLKALLRLYATLLGGVLVVSLLLALLLASRSQRLFTAPILYLGDLLHQVASEGDYTLRATRTTSDEVGDLTEAFNGMLSQIQQRDAALQNARDDLEKRVAERTGELKAAHAQLLDTSRKAGMAEVATNVLHNVGNVLNSVNVSCAVISDHVRHSRSASLAKVAAMFETHKDDLATFLTTDPIGKKLPNFLARLSAVLNEERSAVLAELRSLDQHVEHIKHIVSHQQSHAENGAVVVSETLSLKSLVDKAAHLTGSDRGPATLRVSCPAADAPMVCVDKHKTLQILVNLLRNARDAVVESGRSDPSIEVEATIDSVAQAFCITVSDNGVGVPEANLTKIFSHGFTTKSAGHGFGLHSSSLAAQEMGGSLRAESLGDGMGAKFILVLPMTIG